MKIVPGNVLVTPELESFFSFMGEIRFPFFRDKFKISLKYGTFFTEAFQGVLKNHRQHTTPKTGDVGFSKQGW